MTTSTNYTMQSGIRRSQMITAVAEGSEGKLLILGLSRKNIEKLMEGMPIFKTAEELRAPISVAILFGEVEENIQQQLSMLINESTEIIDNRGSEETA